jgi:signal transduction histidine kinase
MPARLDPPYRGEMLDRVRALATRLRREDWVDLALVGIFAVVVTVDGFSHTLGTTGQGATTAWGLAEIAPLAVRRRFPLAVWLTILALVTAQAAVTGTNEGFGVFFAWLVGVYTVAAHTPRRTAVVSLLLLVPVVAYTNWRSTGSPFEDTAFIVTLLSGFWAAGRVVWSRNQLVLRLAEQSEDLRRGRAAEARALAAEHRERVARDVHDVVAHSVSLMVVQAEAGEAQLPAEAPSAECLRAIQRVGRSTLTELRGLLSALGEDTGATAPDRTDRTRAPSPRLRDADLLVGELAAAGLVVDLTLEGDAEELPAGVDLAAYRILQESLTNALRHAGAATVRARVVAGPDEVVVDVVDFGEGPRKNGHELHGGRGLLGMRERARLYGGEVQAGPTDDGFRVHARIPVPAVAAVER